jgi:hypothetical protein
MKRFKNFISEETMPYAGTNSGTIDIRDSGARDNINRILSGITHGRFVTPYIAFERVSKALANFLIFPPRQGFLEGDSGEVHFEIKQFGEKMGMNDDGTVITAPELPYYIYFEYRLDDNGMFNIFCEVVDEDDLEEIFDDLEDEMNDEDDSEDRLDESHEKPVYEGNSENKEKKNQAIVKLMGHRNIRKSRKKMKGDDVNRDFDPRNLKRVAEATLAGPETGSRKVPGSNQTDMGGDDTSMPDSIKRKVKLKLAEASWEKLTKYQQGARVTRDMTSSLGTKLKRQKGIDLAQRKKWDRNVKVPATLPDEEDETDNNRR